MSGYAARCAGDEEQVMDARVWRAYRFNRAREQTAAEQRLEALKQEVREVTRGQALSYTKLGTNESFQVEADGGSMEAGVQSALEAAYERGYQACMDGGYAAWVGEQAGVEQGKSDCERTGGMYVCRCVR